MDQIGHLHSHPNSDRIRKRFIPELLLNPSSLLPTSCQVPHRFLPDAFQISARFKQIPTSFPLDSYQIPLSILPDSYQNPHRFLPDSCLPDSQQIPSIFLRGLTKRLSDSYQILIRFPKDFSNQNSNLGSEHEILAPACFRSVVG